MGQTLLVGLIVVAAAAYVAWALLPAVTRLRLAQRLHEWALRRARPGWLVRPAAALERAARARVGGCGDCGAVQDAPRPPSSKRPPTD